MKFIKKIIAVVLCFSMITTMLAVGVAAESANISMAVSADKVEVGSTVTVTISTNELTITGLTVILEFDQSKLKCIEVTGARDASEKTKNNMYLFDIDEETWIKALVADSLTDEKLGDTINSDGKFSVAWANATEANYDAGKIATLTFEALEAGDVEFVLSEKSTSDTGSAFEGTAAEYKVTIEAAPCTHNMTAHDAVAATCIASGNVAYYSCSVCGKNFKDEAGTEEIEDVTTPVNEEITSIPHLLLLLTRPVPKPV